MLKWLLISILVLFTFIVLLLGLGYLLKENKIETTAFKQQLEQERIEQKTRLIEKSAKPASLLSTAPLLKSTHSIKQKILLENLTCVSKQQCVLVNIEFSDLNCLFAINTIGASLVKNTDIDKVAVGECPHYPDNSELSCQHNICRYGAVK